MNVNTAIATLQAAVASNPRVGSYQLRAGGLPVTWFNVTGNFQQGYVDSVATGQPEPEPEE